MLKSTAVQPAADQTKFFTDTTAGRLIVKMGCTLVYISHFFNKPARTAKQRLLYNLLSAPLTALFNHLLIPQNLPLLPH